MNQTLPREADFAGAQPRFWNGDDAARTIVLDAFSLMFPSAENFMLRGMQGVHDRLDEPALKRAVAGFVRQEASHARLHRADSSVWTIAAPASQADAARLLRELGVVVVPDGIGGYVHNGSIHVMNAAGKVLAIYDDAEWKEALAMSVASAAP